MQKQLFTKTPYLYSLFQYVKDRSPFRAFVP